MKELFAGFATGGESARSIGAGLQATLHGFADAEVFVLYTIAYGYALLVIDTSGLAHVTEIEIEDYAAVIDIDWDYEIGIQVALVAIEHEVGMEPEIPGAVALARVAGSSIFVGADHGTGLQAIAVFVFDGVLLVIEH